MSSVHTNTEWNKNVHSVVSYDTDEMCSLKDKYCHDIVWSIQADPQLSIQREGHQRPACRLHSLTQV